MREWRASGEPVLAEVGAPFILSLDVAGYLSVIGHAAALSMSEGGVGSCLRCRPTSTCAPFSRRS